MVDLSTLNHKSRFLASFSIGDLSNSTDFVKTILDSQLVRSSISQNVFGKRTRDDANLEQSK